MPTTTASVFEINFLNEHIVATVLSACLGGGSSEDASLSLDLSPLLNNTDNLVGVSILVVVPNVDDAGVSSALGSKSINFTGVGRANEVKRNGLLRVRVTEVVVEVTSGFSLKGGVDVLSGSALLKVKDHDGNGDIRGRNTDSRSGKLASKLRKSDSNGLTSTSFGDDHVKRSSTSTTVGLVVVVNEVLVVALPELSGKLTASAIRVPTPDVSIAVMRLDLEKAATAEEVNAALKAEATGDLDDNLGYSDSKEAVSLDFIGSTHAGEVDALATKCSGNTCIVYVWYDNEYGYSNQVVRVVEHWTKVQQEAGVGVAVAAAA